MSNHIIKIFVEDANRIVAQRIEDQRNTKTGDVKSVDAYIELFVLIK